MVEVYMYYWRMISLFLSVSLHTSDSGYHDFDVHEVWNGCENLQIDKKIFALILKHINIKKALSSEVY